MGGTEYQIAIVNGAIIYKKHIHSITIYIGIYVVCISRLYYVLPIFAIAMCYIQIIHNTLCVCVHAALHAT